MGFLKNLFKNRYTYAGRINMTVFFINIFLILVHVFLSVFYFVANHKIMFIANLVSLLFYISAIFYCTKCRNIFLRVAFFEIWVHTLLGICSFGWDGYFQNWIFALLVAVFLTAFTPDKFEQSYKQSSLFSFILVLSYLLFALLVNTVKFPITVTLSDNMKDVIFAFNNFVTFTAIIFFAVTYTRNKEEKEIELLKKANYDELTGIFNRHGIDSIEYALKGKSYSIAILDLDFFKPVNDKYGHKQGDKVLVGIGNILKSFISKNITVGRWGGEEFIVIGNSDISYEEFVNTLESIRKKVESTSYTINEKNKINITVSIGSKYIKSSKSIEESVALADINLYKAKQTGRNKVVS
jgi:diguanylate cyclase (GGDEF)-like protein